MAAVSAHVTRLSRASLGVDRPPTRIVHLGLGNFHRAHQAWYTERAGDRADWGIAGFAVRGPGLADRLAGQDGLYSLIERGPVDDRVEVIGSVVEAHAGDSPRFVELLAAPTTAIVTVTITEGGYQVGADADPVALRRLAAGLAARRAANAGPIALVSCDNLPGNGDALRHALLMLDPAADDNVSFVSTSVDRITPRLTADELGGLRTASGWDDAAPVVTEPFSDWVLEGAFPAGRPGWDAAGARFVDDVEPFERRKLWLLNGAHTILAASGPGRGHETVAAAFADTYCHDLVIGFWDEAARHLTSAGLDIPNYLEQLQSRFANPRIAHRLSDIADQAPAKVGVRLLPVLRAELAAGRTGAATLHALADEPPLLAILKEEST
ncbi:MAG TPA: mannitol dehydrogenase family protein [Pseudolysinimonas sp.]